MEGLIRWTSAIASGAIKRQIGRACEEVA